MSELHIFLDESGDFGFSDNSSKRFILSFVFHDAADDITENCQAIRYLDYVHIGPLIRKEPPYDGERLETRIKIFRKFFTFFLGLPIKSKSFVYEKDDFKGDRALFRARVLDDLRSLFAIDDPYLSSFDSVVVYYDMGQKEIGNVIKEALDLSNLNYSFKEGVKPSNYRLFQVADLITSIKLVERKINDEGMSASEIKFFGNSRRFKKNYLRAMEKKEL